MSLAVDHMISIVNFTFISTCMNLWLYTLITASKKWKLGASISSLIFVYYNYLGRIVYWLMCLRIVINCLFSICYNIIKEWYIQKQLWKQTAVDINLTLIQKQVSSINLGTRVYIYIFICLIWLQLNISFCRLG